MRNLSITLLLVAGCANPSVGDGPGDNNMPPLQQQPTYDFKKPSLVQVGPTDVALGDTIQVIGSDLIDPTHGTLTLHLKGTFKSQDGTAQNDYDGTVQLVYGSATSGSMEFGPTVFFSNTPDLVGTFQGKATVQSKLRVAAIGHNVGDMLESDPVDAQFRVAPSIMVTWMQTPGNNCQPVTAGTLSGSPLHMGFEVIGINAPSDNGPMQMQIQYSSPNLKTVFLQDNGSLPTVWPLSSPDQKTLASPPDGTVSLTFSTSSAVVDIDPTRAPFSAQVNPAININGSVAQNVVLYQLTAGTVQGFGSLPGDFTVMADTADGTHIQRMVHFNVSSPAELMPYDGNRTLVQIYPYDDSVCGCKSGGINTTFTYSESSSESAQNSLTVEQSNTMGAGVNNGTQIGGSFGTGYNLLIQASVNVSANQETMVNWQSTFGTTIGMVSSKETTQNVSTSVQLYSGQYAACYRQRYRYERRVQALLHDVCGNTFDGEEVKLDENTWQEDIQVGQSCPPPPNPMEFKQSCNGDCPQ